MSVASRPVSTGKTRTCPHCKATILESLSICPGCMHHLRFDSEAAKRQVAAAPALRVEGIIRHPPLEQPLEYFVIIAIRNDRGEEVTRQVVNVGALQAAEKRTFTLSVEVLPPAAPVEKKSTSATGSFKTPAAQPSATVRPSPGSPSGATSEGVGTADPATGAAPGSSASSAATGSHPALGGSGSTATTGSGSTGRLSATTQPLPSGGRPQPSAKGPPSGANTPPGAGIAQGTGNPAGQGQAKPGEKPKPASGYILKRSEERRVGKECRSRWSPYH